MSKKAVAIVVSGGPAPGLNGVISAVTIEARKRGHVVYGIQQGFARLSQGDATCLRKLEISDVSRIQKQGGSILGTSRANPKERPEMMQAVVQTLLDHDVAYFVTIGGDDTAASANAVSEAAEGKISVCHVPKTIDNDLPLPGESSTFGYQTAREAGTAIVETLMEDAKTTGRWYLPIAMGRKAGHLALGIGISAGATMSLIPEEFPGGQVSLSHLADIIVGAIVKRLANGRNYGVAVLAEGLADILDTNSIPELAEAERDPHGNIRFAEVDFGLLVKQAVRSRLAEIGLPKLLVMDKNVGYELRCVDPNSFDREYTRELGFGAIDFLLSGGNRAMITREGTVLRPIPFNEFINPTTGRADIRLVDIESSHYRIARSYQIRLGKDDLQNEEMLARIAAVTSLDSDRFVSEFRHVAC